MRIRALRATFWVIRRRFIRRRSLLQIQLPIFPPLSSPLPPLSQARSNRHIIMDYTYASEISHTRAKVGDTERWAAGLSPLLDAHKSVKLTHRELIKMDTTVLDIELKKASVIRSELENNASFRNSLAAIATKPPALLPENRRWHFKERAMTLCFYFWGTTEPNTPTSSDEADMQQYLRLSATPEPARWA